MLPRTTRFDLVRPASILAACALLFVGGYAGVTSTTGTPTAPAASSGAAPAGTSAPGVPTLAPGAVGGTPAATAPPTATAEPVASTAALATSALPKAKFTTGTASVTLPIEVPPEREYGIGLSGRSSLEGRGMLFAFPDGAAVGFWMKGTHIDLDIAFVDASMRVIEVKTMRADTLDIHKPAANYVAAVEVPAGWYAANAVKVGATVVFDVDLRAATGR